MWHDEMRAKLVAGSNSDDFAELVLRLLHYDSRQRWTATQALQEPCTQAVNAACGYPSTAVPMLPGVLASPTSSSSALSQQSSASDVSENLVMLTKQPDLLELEENLDVEHSPRIASAPGSIAQQYGQSEVLASGGIAFLPGGSSAGFNWTPHCGSHTTVQPVSDSGEFARDNLSAYLPRNAVSPGRFGQELPARDGLDVDRMFASSGLAAVMSDSSEEVSSNEGVDSIAALLLPSDLLDEFDGSPAEPTVGNATAIHQAVASVDNDASRAEHAAHFSSQLSLSLSSAHSSDAADSNVAGSEDGVNGRLDTADREEEAGNVVDTISDISSDVSSEDTDDVEARVEAAFIAANKLHEIEGIPSVLQAAGEPICQLQVGKFFRWVFLPICLPCCLQSVVVSCRQLQSCAVIYCQLQSHAVCRYVYLLSMSQLIIASMNLGPWCNALCAVCSHVSQSRSSYCMPRTVIDCYDRIAHMYMLSAPCQLDDM